MTEQNDKTGAAPGKGPDLNFSLPEYTSGAQRGHGLMVGLGFVILLLVAAQLGMGLLSGGSAPERPAKPAAAVEAMKKLALRLEARGLPEQAARAWADYVETADIDPSEKGQKLAHAAGQMQNAGKYEEAIVFYFRADQLDPPEQLKLSINRGIQECFTRLGKYSDLFYELKDRTSLGSEKVEDGSTIVAEIGPEKITLREFERELEAEIKKRAGAMGGPQTEQYEQYLRQQFASTEAKQRMLGEIITRQVVVREARERQIDKNEAFKKKLAEIADQLAAQEVVQAELDRINLSENDYKLFYGANRDRYKEDPKAKISRILLDDEKAAEELLKTLKSADDFAKADGFAKAAKEKSLDAKTRENGGEVDGEVRPGQWVAAIGQNEELNKAIFSAQPGAILDKLFKTDDGFNIVMVRQKTPERRKTYDEVADQVKREYDEQKQQEVTSAFIRSLFDKHKVTLYPGVLAGEKEAGEANDKNATPTDEKQSE